MACLSSPDRRRFTSDSVRSIRPARGARTRHLVAAPRRRAARNIPRGTALAWDLVAAEGQPVATGEA